MQVVQRLYLFFFLLFRGADHLAGHNGGRAFFAQEGVHANERQLASVLEGFVIQAFFLNLAALVHGFHSAQHAPPLGDAVKLQQNGLFHQFGEFINDESALERILVFGQPQFVVDDELYGHGAAHRFLGRRGDGLVVCVGVQRVAVVVYGIQRLQGGADVVEGDLLGVQAAARRLDVVLEHLAALVGLIQAFHGFGPQAARHTADHGVFRIHAVGKEKREVGRKVVYVHAPAAVVFHKRETVGQREGELGNGVGPGLGNVVARDGHRVKIANIVVHKILGNVAHDLERKLGREDAGVLALVFFQDVGLHRAAHIGQHPFADLGRFGGCGLASVLGLELVEVLVNGRVHEHGQNGRRRAVDGHGHRGGRVAQIKARVQHFHVVQRGHAHA